MELKSLIDRGVYMERVRLYEFGKRRTIRSDGTAGTGIRLEGGEASGVTISTQSNIGR
jgi:hypothetical protein